MEDARQLKKTPPLTNVKLRYVNDRMQGSVKSRFPLKMSHDLYKDDLT